MLRLVLVADHPKGDHVLRVVERLRTNLEEAIARGVEPQARLRFPYGRIRIEPVLAYAAARRTGEHAGLQRRHPDVPIEVRTPRRLIRLDQQLEAATAGLVASG
jgi:hypothetical protein